MTCINCGFEQTGKFCGNCGQPLEVKRLTLRDAWEDIWEHVSGFDGKLARTFKDLTLRPGFAAREFIHGNRARYYGPIAYYLLMVTSFLVYLSIIDLSYFDYIKSMQQSVVSDAYETEFARNIRMLVSDNLKTFAFCTAPFMAFASRYIYFRKQGLNFLEHAVPSFYMFGHWYWFQMIEATTYKITGTTVGTGWQLLMMVTYFGFGYTSFITTQSKQKVFLKGVGTYLTGFFFFMTVVTIIIVIWLAVMYVNDPELLKTVKPLKQTPLK
jgi:hypothetical protein